MFFPFIFFRQKKINNKRIENDFKLPSIKNESKQFKSNLSRILIHTL
jgi:hypothetical protein